jgi:hypothetical protein
VHYVGHYTTSFQNAWSLQHKIPTVHLQKGLNVQKHQPSESKSFTTIRISNIALNLRDWLQWTGTRPREWLLMLSRYCTDHQQLSQTQPLTHNSGLQELFCTVIMIMLNTFLYCLRLLFNSVAGIVYVLGTYIWLTLKMYLTSVTVYQSQLIMNTETLL